MNRCSKLLCYVYEIPNAFIGRIPQADPSKKLASVVKQNTRRALGIAVVGFVGDHLKAKRATEFSTLDRLTFMWRSGTSDPVSNPSYSSRVCAKCALKFWTAVELARFLKANLNPVVATSDDCETQQRWKRKSKSLTSEEKPKSAKIPTAEPESQASALGTPTTTWFSTV